MRLAAVSVPGDAAPWAALGFAVVDGSISLGNGAIRTGSAGLGLELAGVDDLPGDLEGLPVSVRPVLESVPQPNGALELDHVVVMTSSLDRTSAAIEAGWGMRQRRVRETDTVRQAFHRFDDEPAARGCIVEVVERPGIDRTSLWGVVVNVADLDAAVAAAGGSVGEPKSAVQPGRRIATVRREAGLPLAVALMST